MASNDPTSAPVLVLGLGRFGFAVAKSLVRLGHDVLGVDEDANLVQRYASEFTHVVAADTTDTEALQQIGAEQFDVAVVGKPDEVRGEAVAAYVVLAPGTAPADGLAVEPQQLVRNQYSAHAYPRVVHFVEELPKTPSGKVQRYLLRQRQD